MGNFIAKFKDGSTVRVPDWCTAQVRREEGNAFPVLIIRVDGGHHVRANASELLCWGPEALFEFEPFREDPPQETTVPEGYHTVQEGPFKWTLPHGSVIKHMHDRIIIEGPIPEDEPEDEAELQTEELLVGMPASEEDEPVEAPEGHDCDDCKYEDLRPDVEPCESCRKVRHQYPLWEPKEVPES